MKNLHLFRVKYLGATDTLGTRIRITSGRFKTSIVLNRNYATEANEQAEKELEKRGFGLIGQCEDRDETVFISNTFKNLT